MNRSYFLIKVFLVSADKRISVTEVKAMKAKTTKEAIKGKLRAGEVYRASDFEELSSNATRDLKQLEAEGVLKYLEPSLYYRPKQASFGEVAASECKLLRKFLQSDDFVVYNPSKFNGLRLGMTQVYNKKVVFNTVRSGVLTVGGREFHFRKWRKAPKKVTAEFLLVEMVNTLDSLAEDRAKVLETLADKMDRFESQDLSKALANFGNKSTQKTFKKMMSS
jgi:hypothetical protein